MSTYKLEVDGETKEVNVEWTGDSYQATVDGQTWEISLTGDNDTSSSDEDADSTTKSSALPASEEKEIQPEKGVIYAPIAGSVKTVLVSEGDQVSKGQSVVLLEAMKMETEITAGEDGQVSDVLIGKNDRVEENQPLIRLDSE